MDDRKFKEFKKKYNLSTNNTIYIPLCIYVLSKYLQKNTYNQLNNNGGCIMFIALDNNNLLNYISSYDKISNFYNFSIFAKNQLAYTYKLSKTLLRSTNMFVVTSICYILKDLKIKCNQLCIKICIKNNKITQKKYKYITKNKILYPGYGFIGIDYNILLKLGVLGNCI